MGAAAGIRADWLAGVRRYLWRSIVRPAVRRVCVPLRMPASIAPTGSAKLSTDIKVQKLAPTALICRSRSRP
eukprot:scaffold14091_cov121-Isochrysis_galbana.AAC.8